MSPQPEAEATVEDDSVSVKTSPDMFDGKRYRFKPSTTKKMQVFLLD